MKLRKAVFIVAYRKNPIEYLILKRKLHWKGWEFPKGGVEKENLIKAVKRELFEETGLKAKRIIRFPIKGKFKYDKKTQEERNFSGQSYTLFAAEVKNDKITYDKLEHSGYKWLPFNKAIKVLTWNNQKKSLKIVNNSIG